MRWRLSAFVLLPLLVAGTVYAAVDLSADDMREAEETLHNLDSRISLQDSKSLDDAKELARYFQQVEGHFGAKSDAARGVEFARKSREHATAIVKAVAAQDYDAAQDRLGDLTRSCKTCHEVYKKK